MLYGRALGLTHSDAEDVLQDTFVALTQLDRPPRDPERFAIRAYRNRALNHHRSLLRRLKREAAACDWFEHDNPPCPGEMAAINALAKLPPKQREVVVLKVWHQLTFDAIASIVKASPNTVAARYRYGLGKIRKAMAYNPMETPDEQPDTSGTLPAFLETPWSVRGAQEEHI